MRILVVEDDDEMGFAIKAQLQKNNYIVDLAADGVQGSLLAATNEYDLVVLDYGLPAKNGYQVCREIRLAGKTMPILMLTIQSEIDYKVKLLDAGADDYIVKPYSGDELSARVRALLRRPQKTEASILQIDDLTLNTQTKEVFRSGQKIYLTRKTYILLEYFMKNQRAVLSRDKILQHVWDRNADLFSKTIDIHIMRLRRQIKIPGGKKLIYAVPGCGYKIDLTE